MRNALALLTVLPTGRRPLPAMGSADLLAFPLVGLLVGLVWAGAAAAGTVWWGPLVAAAAVLIADAIVTGGLHLDGVADVGDTVGSRRRGPAALEIARDPRVGALGVVVLACTLLLRFALVATLVAAARTWTLWAVPVVGRAAMLHAIHRCQPDEQSLVRPLASRTTPAILIVALLSGIVALTVAGVPPTRTMAVVSGVVALVESGTWGWRRRFGNGSGDLVGALGIGAEVTVLLVLAAGSP